MEKINPGKMKTIIFPKTDILKFPDMITYILAITNLGFNIKSYTASGISLSILRNNSNKIRLILYN